MPTDPMTALSYQLYSSREFPPLDDTLAMLADTGYRETEGFPGNFGDPQAVRAAHDKAGLAMSSAHFPVGMLMNDRGAAIGIAGTLGAKSIFAPYLHEQERPGDVAGWRAFAQQLETLGGIYTDAGFHFGWHNHDFEFHPLPDGTVPMTVILEEAPSIGWEADLAWLVRAGADPLRWIADHGDRITAVHIKDIAPDGECLDEDGWADVGFGTMDWAGLMTALRSAPVRHFIMEHDKPGDDARFAGRSFRMVSNLLRAP